MKLYFARHGQTQFNKDGLITGQIDELLIEEGVKEAEETMKNMATDFTEIYSSDLLRCKQTAEILNKKLNLEIKYDKRLRERNFGSIAGGKFQEIDPSGEMRRKDMDCIYSYREYGGESVDDVKNRLFSFINEIKNKKSKILIVTHGGIIRLLHNTINNQKHDHVKNSSIHEFEF